MQAHARTDIGALVRPSGSPHRQRQLFTSVQHTVDFSDIGHVGSRAAHAVHESGAGALADVRFHSRTLLVDLPASMEIKARMPSLFLMKLHAAIKVGAEAMLT